MGANDSTAVLDSPLVAVASVDGSKYAVPQLARDKVILLSDDTLLVGKSYRTDMAVLSYKDALRRMGVEFTEQETDPETIKNLYAGGKLGEAVDTDNISEVQSIVLGYIKEAVRDKSSDIHFRNYQNQTVILWRTHGALYTRHVILPTDGLAYCRCMYEAMTDDADNTYKVRESQDGRLSRRFMKEAGLSGARIATRPMEYGNLVVLRLLYHGDNSRVQTYEGAGYHVTQIPLLNRMMRRKGVVLFSGETGSGKSSSLVVMLRKLLELYRHRIHLLTIENPLEYVIEGAVQTVLIGDLKTPQGISQAWAGAITNAVRLDIDYLMVAELRDIASALAAFQAAMTGHGLFSTIHAEEIFTILDRLADFGLHERHLANPKRITGLINQSLAPILCPTCSQKRPFSKFYKDLDEETAERTRQFCKTDNVFLRAEDSDCPQCGGMGYIERKIVGEVCMTTKALLDVYRLHGSAEARTYWVKEMGGLTKNQHVIERINAGQLDPFDGDTIVPLDEDSLTIG